MITASSLISIVVWIVILGLVFGLLWWIIGIINLPEPFNKVARVILALFAVIFLINILLGIVVTPLIIWK